MAIVKCGNFVRVNAACVSSFVWDLFRDDRRSFFIIYMANGVEHRLQHCPDSADGLDCYQIEKELIAEIKRLEKVNG